VKSAFRVRVDVMLRMSIRVEFSTRKDVVSVRRCGTQSSPCNQRQIYRVIYATDGPDGHLLRSTGAVCGGALQM
jgi:hypothetical protein